MNRQITDGMLPGAVCVSKIGANNTQAPLFAWTANALYEVFSPESGRGFRATMMAGFGAGVYLDLIARNQNQVWT